MEILIVCLVVLWLHTRELKHWSKKLEQRLARHERFLGHHSEILANLAEGWGTDTLVSVELTLTGQRLRFTGIGHFDGEVLPVICLIEASNWQHLLSGIVMRTTAPDEDERPHYCLVLAGIHGNAGVTTEANAIVDGVLRLTADPSAVGPLVDRLYSDREGW